MSSDFPLTARRGRLLFSRPFTLFMSLFQAISLIVYHPFSLYYLDIHLKRSIFTLTSNLNCANIMLSVCYEVDSASLALQTRTMQRQSECGPLVSLPDDCITRPYKDIKHLQLATQVVLDRLARNHGGNQFIVLLNIPADAAERFETDKAGLGRYSSEPCGKGMSCSSKLCHRGTMTTRRRICGL